MVPSKNRAITESSQSAGNFEESSRWEKSEQIAEKNIKGFAEEKQFKRVTFLVYLIYLTKQLNNNSITHQASGPTKELFPTLAAVDLPQYRP